MTNFTLVSNVKSKVNTYVEVVLQSMDLSDVALGREFAVGTASQKDKAPELVGVV